MAGPQANRLLTTIPAAEVAKLRSMLEPVSLPLLTVLFEQGEVPEYVHFITSGLASIVTTMLRGDAVEVGLIGHEGFPESLHLLGPETGETRCFMQIAGTGLRMGFKQFQDEFTSNPGLHGLVLRQVQHEALVMGQLLACNRLQEVEERLARWLLMVADRTGDLEFQLTQEFLGEMLGTRRSTVTIAAGALQRSGMIEYRRGRIKILDPDNLREAACECYAVTRRLYEQLYR